MAKKNQFKIVTLVAFLLLSTILGTFLFFLLDNHRYTDLSEIPWGNHISRVDANIKIAIVGDSWAAGAKLDPFLEKCLEKYGIDAKTVSYGHPGGKSRDILEDLLNGQRSKPFLEDGEIDYFIVFAGINDSKGHDGAEFYRHHIAATMRLIESYGAVPIIIDIPDYAPELEHPPTLVHAVKRFASLYLFDSAIADNRDRYRDGLREVTSAADTVIDHSLLPAYHSNPGLWRDPIHLNEEGYRTIAEAIASAIDNLRVSSPNYSDKEKQ